VTPVGWGGVVTGTIAAESNSLIVAPAMPGWMDGVGPFEDGYNLGTSFQNGDWVQGVLSGASIVVTGVDAVINPIATLISLGVGWMLEHIWPLSDWLDQLTGDHQMVLSYATIWTNVSGSVGQTAAELDAALSGIAHLSGFAVDAYRAVLQTMSSALAGAAGLTAAISLAVEMLSSLVKMVHDLVRDVISDLVGFIAQSLILAAATVGTAAPAIAAQAASKTAKWTLLLTDFITDLVTSTSTYVGLANTLYQTFEGISETLDTHLNTV
jgi:hypothetical protein